MKPWILATLLASSLLASSATVSTSESAAGTTLSISFNNFHASDPGLGGDTLITATDGHPLGQGRAHLGTFTPAFNLNEAIATWNLSTLINNFHPVLHGPVLTPSDWAAIGHDGVALKGFYNADADQILWPDSQFDQDVYLFIGDGMTLQSSTGFGLIRHFTRIISTSSPPFVVSDPLTDFSSPYHFNGVLHLNAGPVSQVFTGEIVLGIPGVFDMSDPYLGIYEGAMSTLQLVAIPEPSTTICITIAGLVVFRRRRTAS